MKVKKQHYISRCLLENFADTNNQVYELLINKKIYQTNINNSMCENYAYEHSNLKQNFLEHEFSKIENTICPYIKDIVHELEKVHANNSIYNIKSKILKIIPELVIFYYRSGALLHESGFGKDKKESRIYPLVDKIFNPYYVTNLSNTIRILYKFAIIANDSNSYLLSDQFISTVSLKIKNQISSISNRNIGLRDTMLLIPISSNYYCVFYHGRKPDFIIENRINNLNESQVQEINKIIVNNSYNKCICQSKDDLEKASKCFKFKSPVEVIIGFKSGNKEGHTLKKEIFYYPDDEIAWDLFHNIPKLNDLLKAKDNDFCPCGSEKLFSDCCKKYYIIIKRMIDDINAKIDARKYLISSKATIEKSIDSFFTKK